MSQSKTVAGSSAAPITVHVHGKISALIPGFVARREADVEEIGAALQRDDWATIAVLGHRMLGNGASMGFTAISRIGEALEAAAAAADRATVDAQRAELRDYLDRIDVVFV